MKYGIAIFPSKHIQDAANAFRKRYDPKYALIPPHITLKSPFTINPKEKQALITALKEVANQHEPFNIEINKYSSFAPVNETIYYNVKMNEQITSLYEDIRKTPFPGNEAHPFVPHITIAQELEKEEYADVFGQLKMNSLDYTDTIDRFHLLYQLENNSWTVYESFVFGKEQL